MRCGVCSFRLLCALSLLPFAVGRRDGACDAWLDGACQETRCTLHGLARYVMIVVACSPHVGRTLAATVNGPMLEKLARRIQYGDCDCVNLLRKGAMLYDDNIDDLWQHCHESNLELLQSMTQSEDSALLHARTLADAELGRMSKPVLAEEVDLRRVSVFRRYVFCCVCRRSWQVRLVPRFAIVQGLKPDGEKKIRPVDHMSWSHSAGKGRKRTRAMVKAGSINGHYSMPEAVHHDHLDDLLATMRMHVELIGEVGPSFCVCQY